MKIEEMKYKWYFTPMMPMDEKRNYLTIFRDAVSKYFDIKNGEVDFDDGPFHPVISLENLKEYLDSHMEMDLYDFMIDALGDEELYCFLQENDVRITKIYDTPREKEMGVKRINNWVLS